jgi:hypothetical protein
VTRCAYATSTSYGYLFVSMGNVVGSTSFAFWVIFAPSQYSFAAENTTRGTALLVVAYVWILRSTSLVFRGRSRCGVRHLVGVLTSGVGYTESLFVIALLGEFSLGLELWRFLWRVTMPNDAHLCPTERHKMHGVRGSALDSIGSRANLPFVIYFALVSRLMVMPFTGLASSSRKRAQKSVAPPPLIIAARMTLAPFFSVRRFETPSSMTACRSL